VIGAAETSVQGWYGASSLLAEPETAQQKLALVIPTLREADNILGVLDQVRFILDPVNVAYEILVVDDDSRDGTDALVSAVTAQDPRVRLIVRKGETGLSGAILFGWQNTDASILGVMDADLQHPPEILPQLLQAILEGSDLAIGSRYTLGGELGAWNPLRKFLSAAAIWVTWPLQSARARAKDPMSGLFMVRRSCLSHVNFQKTGFKLLLEVLVRGDIQSVKEIPFAFGLRRRGFSKANLKVGWDYALLLVKLYSAKFGLRRRS